MQFEIVATHKLDGGHTNPISLHSYQSSDLAILFIYRDDRKYRENHFFAHGFEKKLNVLLLLNWFKLAAILCYLRRRARLRRDGYISCLLDMFIAAFGGGNIRITHRYERWFFSIVFIENIFIMAIWSVSTFYPTFFELDQSIKSIKEIAAINPPIFINPSLKYNDEDVVDMLRYVVHLFFS